MSGLELLERWQDRDAVPLVEVTRALGMTQGEYQHIVKQKMIDTLPPQRGAKTRITFQAVITLVVAALIARASSIAIIEVLRQFKATGAQVTPHTVMIPVPVPTT